MTTDSAAAPPAVDCFGVPLNVGDSVGFILVFGNDPGIYSGRIALIGDEQVCVQSGTLHLVRGEKGKPAGKPEQIRYSRIIRRVQGDGT